MRLSLLDFHFDVPRKIAAFEFNFLCSGIVEIFAA